MIKRILKSLYIRLQKKKNVLKWRYESRKLRLSYTYKRLPLLDNCTKTIILIPHADDEWVGCSTIVSGHTDVILCNMDMVGGDSESLHKVRFNELANVANLCQKRLITLTGDKKINLRKIILENHIEKVFVPFFFDWHEEHRETMHILRAVLKKIEEDISVIMYQVSLPIVETRINYANGYDRKTWNLKWSNFEEFYKTQISIPYKRFAFSERINGALTNSYGAEVFSVCSKDEWLINFDNWLLEEQEILQVKRKLQDMIAVNKLTGDFVRRRIWKTQK